MAKKVSKKKEKSNKETKSKVDWKGVIKKVLFDEAGVDDKINVSVSMSVTMNIGNYESLKYGISTSMDCKQSKADLVRAELEQYIEEKLRDKYKTILANKSTEDNEPQIDNIEEEIIEETLSEDNKGKSAPSEDNEIDIDSEDNEVDIDEVII